VARIRAVLRRVGQSEPPGHVPLPVEVGPLVIDRRRHTVTVDDHPIALTPKEYDLLLCLALDAGAVKTREQLMREVWDEHWWGSTKTLDVHIASLRRKLRPELIETVRSVGYRFVGSDEPTRSEPG
jgi:DNA-binding response OmpR family regulator